MTDEQKEFNGRCWRGFIALDWLKRMNKNKPKASKNLVDVQEIFSELVKFWREHLDEPIDIKPAVKAQWLRELADQIEEGDEP